MYSKEVFEEGESLSERTLLDTRLGPDHSDRPASCSVDEQSAATLESPVAVQTGQRSLSPSERRKAARTSESVVTSETDIAIAKVRSRIVTERSRSEGRSRPSDGPDGHSEGPLHGEFGGVPRRRVHRFEGTFWATSDL